MSLLKIARLVLKDAAFRADAYLGTRGEEKPSFSRALGFANSTFANTKVAKQAFVFANEAASRFLENGVDWGSTAPRFEVFKTNPQ